MSFLTRRTSGYTRKPFGKIRRSEDQNIRLSEYQKIRIKKNKMITAIILINTERGKVNLAGAQIASIEGVQEVWSVSGRYDLVAIIRIKHIDDLARIATEKLATIDGITHTESMVAFKKISPGDIVGMLDLGS